MKTWSGSTSEKRNCITCNKKTGSTKTLDLNHTRLEIHLCDSCVVDYSKLSKTIGKFQSYLTDIILDQYR